METKLDIEKNKIKEKLDKLYHLSNEIIEDIRTLKTVLHVDEQIIDNIKSLTIITPAFADFKVTKEDHKEFIDYYLNQNFLFDKLYELSSQLPCCLNIKASFCEVDLFSDTLKVKICE